jgi:His/Glu/Gln/Arg/opine family amino acid ABC transporter permease subunit
MGYHFDFGGIVAYLPAFRSGIWITLQLTFYSCVFGTVLGLPVAALLTFPHPAVRAVLVLAVDTIRAVPDLVLFFFFFYFPYREVFGIEPLRPFISAVLAMTTILTMYCGDLFREAARQAPRSQALGLRGIGFSSLQVFRYATLPAVVRHALPSLVAFWIGILKMSSLASAIGVNDTVFVAKIGMAQSYRSLEAWITVALVYVVLVLPPVYGMRILQGRPWMQRQ